MDIQTETTYFASVTGGARKTPADVSRPWDVSAAAQAAKTWDGMPVPDAAEKI